MSGALLLALPTNQADFLARIESSDYLRRFSIDPKGSWRLTYQDVAEAWLAIAEAASHAGMAVFENVSLSDLSLATKQFQTVVLVSHWKGPAVLPEDLTDKNPQEYVAKAQQAATASALCLQQAFALKPPHSMIDVCQIMTNFIQTTDAWRKHHGDDFEVAASPFTIQSWNRDELDSLFGGVLMRPGNRVEFADGLYDKETVKDAVDGNFQGLLDLTTCTSTVLSDYLVRTSRARYRTVQFEKPQKPALTGLLLERTFHLYAEGMSYSTARVQAYKDLVKVVETCEVEAKPQSLLARLGRRFLNIGRQR
ncbi:MAG TPA: hypothetical protein VIF10_02720 [Methylobacter sp.]|jgi:hypothetical protein